MDDRGGDIELQPTVGGIGNSPEKSEAKAPKRPSILKERVRLAMREERGEL
jgi:hypothetical protein